MFENKTQRTELSEIGEFGLIKHIEKSVKTFHSETIKGIGDDAAVIESDGKIKVVTTDMLLEGIHFDLAYSPLKHLGYKAVVVNLSDIYAMNALPKQILVSIGLSNRFSLEAVEELYSGINMACEKYKVDLIGGDTSSSASGLVISVTAIGSAENKNEIVYRNSAKENDLICVSGDLGAAYLGLQLLNREKKIFLENPKVQPDLSGFDYLLERQLKPEARKDIIKQLKIAGVKPTSMIDISDGLASELFHICTQSETGCIIYEKKIPVDVKAAELAQEFNLNPTVCALSGGEDYELLFTIAQKDYAKIQSFKDISVIGNITNKSDGMKMSDASGNEIELKAQGWNAFH